MEIRLAAELEEDDYVKKFIDNYNIEINKNSRYMLSYSNIRKNTIICHNDSNESIAINVSRVIYFESFEGEVFIKIKGEILKVKMKLFEIEKLYNDYGFIRINKSQILNIYQINKIRGSFSRKFILDMENGETLEVNRTYYTNFKERLGI